MLTVELHSISPDLSIEDALHLRGFGIQKGTYFYTKGNIKLEGVIDSDKRSLKINIPPQLNLKQYTIVHHIIKNLILVLNAEYNDSQSLLGYLTNGEGAYIITNWDYWVAFLQKAKLRSLEGKKVQVFDETNKEIASGMFISYKMDEQSSNIIECILITHFGERSFKGSSLLIEATNEW
ncbi:hypothetical protein COJ46_11610 [Bacillus sp. AFS077874]|uniref:hypothetical protein n=1 Tax=Bacillus sp. AFS077874 TaxID=2033513 RepID=UPI000BF92F65|nr:hypothetical protein [Bacillus sp. AFS077874]PFM79967.1 hypothetical protein COJ46_11610 [Bacillus sp. AFS077874]